MNWMVAIPVKSSFSEGVFAGHAGLQPVLLCVLRLGILLLVCGYERNGEVIIEEI